MASLLGGLFGNPLGYVPDDNGGMVLPLIASDPFADRWVCRGMAAPYALSLITRHFRLPMAEAQAEFDHLGEGGLKLLDSPAGWALLGDLIARGVIGKEDALASPPVPIIVH
jgi:hypothetical protein